MLITNYQLICVKGKRKLDLIKSRFINYLIKISKINVLIEWKLNYKKLFINVLEIFVELVFYLKKLQRRNFHHQASTAGSIIH